MVEYTMKGTNYLSIIVDLFHPYMVSVFLTGNGVFQQANILCHMARIMLPWFEKHACEFQLIPWLPNSPDLNPIEHVQDIMDQGLRA